MATTGYFVSYLSTSVNNGSKDAQIIVEATSNTIWVESIIITNLGDNDIRISVKRIRTSTDNTTTETFLTYNFPVPSYQNPKVYGDKILFNTIDLVSVLGIRKNLQYTSEFSEKLVCYTNGPTQYYDCVVDYALLNELP